MRTLNHGWGAAGLHTLVLLFLLVLSASGCRRTPVSESAPADLSVPRWAQEAVWYQIFVERFRNGDPGNDPRLEDIQGAWPEIQPEGWQVTPWGWDWHQQEEWARATGRDFYYTVQLRRYGGDLQGVIDRLDYLQELGVTALYFNPINDAPSLHKYDARNYRHVDRNFGPDPAGDRLIMAAEIPEDPSTWNWTAADRLFLDLVADVHRRGMRLILDYSWNHTGTTFWAWQDLLKNQRDSRFAEWYEVESFDDPATVANEFTYQGWAGVPNLPNLAKVGRPAGRSRGPIEGDLHDEVKEHVLAVTRRWLDPNGDGDTSDGIDGFRLDVAEHVPLGFWRDYRRFVRGINPEAYLVGEVWWEDWPERMYDPAPWLQGDAFDAVMNYRWYAAARRFFAGAPEPISADEFRQEIRSQAQGLSVPHQLAQMNLTASHDSPRFSTSIFNPGVYKSQVNPREDPSYKLHRPDESTVRLQRLMLVHQFTFPGAPHIWNGDEMGMWGADDPDCRKPLMWEDISFQVERAHPLGKPRPEDLVGVDHELRAFYRRLIGLRREDPALFVWGDLEWLDVGDPQWQLAYRRRTSGRDALVLLNKASRPVTLQIEAPAGESYRPLLFEGPDLVRESGALKVTLPALGAAVLLAED